jgi:hypothetical protein
MKSTRARRQKRRMTSRWRPFRRVHGPGDTRRRSVRHRPQRRAPTVVLVACAFGVGALFSYLWDPDRGHARRVRLHNQSFAALRHRRRELTRARTRLLRRAEGRVRAQWHRIPRSPGRDRPDDVTLVDKIRSEVLGQARFHGLPINVDACAGVVHLRGELPEQARIDDLVAATGRVVGVRMVQSFLHLPGQLPPNKQDALLARVRNHWSPASN